VSSFTAGLHASRLREHQETKQLKLLKALRALSWQREERRVLHATTQRRRVSPVSKVMSDALKGIRVLVVEDDDDTRDLLKVLLESEGSAVAATSSVQQALAAYDQSRPDVIIADIGMPEYNGYTLIGKVRAKDREHGGNIVPAIALTAFTTAIDRDTVLSAGFQLHMPKPFEPHQLISVVSQLAKKYPRPAGS